MVLQRRATQHPRWRQNPTSHSSATTFRCSNETNVGFCANLDNDRISSDACGKECLLRTQISCDWLEHPTQIMKVNVIACLDRGRSSVSPPYEFS